MENHPSDLWRGYWGIQVLAAGQSLGLFRALRSEKSAQKLAGEQNLEERYTKLWCLAAESFGFLEKNGDKYKLVNEHSQWLLDSQGFTQSHLHLSHRFQETVTAVFSGRALPEPPISLRFLLQDHLQTNYRWLYESLCGSSAELSAILNRQSRVLEVGCGVGYGLQHLNKFHPQLELFGLEADFECAQEAERATKSVIHVGQLPKGRFQGEFDLVVCFRSLAASPSPEGLVSECSQLLKKGGLFLLGSEFQAQGQTRKSEARVRGEHLAYCVLAGEGLKHSFSEKQIKQMLESAQLEVLTELKAPDWATPAFLARKVT